MIFSYYTPSKLVLPDYLFCRSFVGKLLLTIFISQIFCVTFYMSLAISLLRICCSQSSFIFILDCLMFHWRFVVLLTIRWVPALCLLQVLLYRFEENYVWFNNVFCYGIILFYFLTFLLVLLFFRYVSVI